MKLILYKIFNKQKQRFIGTGIDEIIYCCKQLENDKSLLVDYIVEYNKNTIGIIKIHGYDLVDKFDISKKHHRCPYCLEKNSFVEIDGPEKSPVDNVYYRDLRPF